MSYTSLEECLLHLEKNNQLIRIREEVDPCLEMAAIHLRVNELNGPAILFENIKGNKFRAASNIFGTLDRSRLIFGKTFSHLKKIIALKKDPSLIFKKGGISIATAFKALNALPLKKNNSLHSFFDQISLDELPHIKHWPNDGGAFITLPQVYTENLLMPGIKHSNLGMYRIQLNENDYIPNREAGLHYQLHRGIGIHQTIAQQENKPLRVSVFVGGPPAHTLAAIMPLPENMSELTFAGILGGRRFRYSYQDGYCISHDADFVITGEVMPGEVKPEGPFGDHLGYYSMMHDFPLLKIKKVYARKNAIWPFTVVGRPPQEDTAFGALIHELTGDVLQEEIPGLKELHAVDAAGVHPLLLAIGSERYTPYADTKRPAELLTIANHILGSSQLSLAKYVWITAGDKNSISTKRIPEFFQYILSRIDFKRDLHFYTQTSIDTLDYSGNALNEGSKIVFAAYGETERELSANIPASLDVVQNFNKPVCIFPGALALQGNAYINKEIARKELNTLIQQLESCKDELMGFPLIVLCDDTHFINQCLNNFLWVTFTRSDPAQDIFGVGQFIENKHWGCMGPLIIDARMKPGYAPPLIKDPEVEKKVDRLFLKSGSLYGLK
ncbi:MAG: UbiD family decarboxylase [Bacteroidetes bacterium]|mgnify:CR=1 FL=1|nr:UbiD family decarboxylase [Bacteroidota bacterium]